MHTPTLIVKGNTLRTAKPALGTSETVEREIKHMYTSPVQGTLSLCGKKRAKSPKPCHAMPENMCEHCEIVARRMGFRQA